MLRPCTVGIWQLPRGSSAATASWCWPQSARTAPRGPPVATVNGTALDGETHRLKMGDRTYYMHFVRVSGLAPRATYAYTVRSGADGAVESHAYAFRAPYASGVTTLAMYGDMGVYTWNDMPVKSKLEN